MKKLDIKKIGMDAVAVGAGAVIAAKVSGLSLFTDKKADGSPKISGLIRGAILVAAGGLLPNFLGKGKGKGLVEGVGAGMQAVGAITLANNTVFKAAPIAIAGPETFPTLGSVDASNFITEDYVQGMPTVGNIDNLSI